MTYYLSSLIDHKKCYYSQSNNSEFDHLLFLSCILHPKFRFVGSGELLSIVQQFQNDAIHVTNELVRQLKLRDRLLRKRDCSYDIITAILQASSPKRSKFFYIVFLIVFNEKRRLRKDWSVNALMLPENGNRWCYDLAVEVVREREATVKDMGGDFMLSIIWNSDFIKIV